ncbi:unnamed protein product [Orchesella dallaii]|uniref:Uncharacterized protein n=1 Tax=Orchesella dallaii TaxID=48710 RepID=A0ABP1QGW2_9HEXA
MNSSRRRLDNSGERYAHIASNGLRVTKRTSQAVTLAWPENEQDVVTFTDSNVSCFDLTTELDSNGNWFEVQMKTGEGSKGWVTIYKGYGLRCEVDGLKPDTLVLFRMKRNGDKKWGTEIIASTDPPPVSAEDLGRAVEMNSEYLVTRILGNTQAPLLKRLLGSHDRNGMTPLMVACHNGNFTIAKMLLSCGSRVNDASTGIKRSSLMFACIMAKFNIVQLLDQHGADWHHKDKGGCSSMHHAINGGHMGIVRLAFAKMGQKSAFEKDHSGWTPLMRTVITSNNLDIVKFLVGKGADPNGVDRSNSKSILMAAILSQKLEFVRFLLEWGADPYFKNKNGKNCIEIAKGLGYQDIAKAIRGHMETPNQVRTKSSFVLSQEAMSVQSSLRSVGAASSAPTDTISSLMVDQVLENSNDTDDPFPDFPGPVRGARESAKFAPTGKVTGADVEYLMKPTDVKKW